MFSGLGTEGSECSLDRKIFLKGYTVLELDVPMIKNYERWCELMKISLVANCNIPTYDIEANQQLGLILDKIKEYNFSL